MDSTDIAITQKEFLNFCSCKIETAEACSKLHLLMLKHLEITTSYKLSMYLAREYLKYLYISYWMRHCLILIMYNLLNKSVIWQSSQIWFTEKFMTCIAPLSAAAFQHSASYWQQCTSFKHAGDLTSKCTTYTFRKKKRLASFI